MTEEYAAAQQPQCVGNDADAQIHARKSAIPPEGLPALSAAEESAPMLEVHAPHEAIQTWRDFFIHIATITVGLLIAIGLEQSVEALHHQRQRHQLNEDLHKEAERNQQTILRDLSVQNQESWFREAITHATGGASTGDQVSLTLPVTPCTPGSVGTAQTRYFAPSEAVWTTAKESDLVALLPAEQARIYARLGHNDELLGGARDHVAEGCDKISAMQRRFAARSPDGSTEVWTLSRDRAGQFADAASETDVAIRALVFRLRWTLGYEEAILRGVQNVDEMMMVINQQKFEP